MTDGKKIRIGKLDSIGGVITEMGRVYRQMRRKELDTLDGSRLVGALREIRCAMEHGEFERPIEALEAGHDEGFGTSFGQARGTPGPNGRLVD